MITVYQYDDAHVFTGDQKNINTGAGVPIGWTRAEPPEVPNGKFAVFSGRNGWAIVDERPVVKEPVPAVITKRQAKQQLVIAGLYDLAIAAIDAIEDAQEKLLMQIFWDESQEFERHHPRLVALGESLGLTSEQMDELFTQANKL